MPSAVRILTKCFTFLKHLVNEHFENLEKSLLQKALILKCVPLKVFLNPLNIHIILYFKFTFTH